MESLNKTDREKLISIILDYGCGYGDLYVRTELERFPNKKLSEVLYSLFEEIEVKKSLEKKCH